MTKLSELEVLQNLVNERCDPPFLLLSTIQSMLRVAGKQQTTIKLKEAIDKNEVPDAEIESFIENLMKTYFRRGYIFYFENVLFSILIALKDRFLAGDAFAHKYVIDLASLDISEIHYATVQAKNYIKEYNTLDKT